MLQRHKDIPFHQIKELSRAAGVGSELAFSFRTVRTPPSFRFHTPNITFTLFMSKLSRGEDCGDV